MNIKHLLPLALVLFFFGLAYAIPGVPAQYFGEVKFLNGPALDGMLVSARIDGQEVANGGVYQSKYGYSPALFFIRDPDGVRRNTTVEFFVNGIKANETIKFDNGASLKLDLSVPVEISAQQAIEAGIKEVSVSPTKPQILIFGSDLQIALSSEKETKAQLGKIEKITTVLPELDSMAPEWHFLTGYEISIQGSVQPTITLNYDESQVKVSEKTIKPFKFKNDSWQEISGFVLNHITNSVTFTVNAAETPYALFDDSGAKPSCENIVCDDGNECTADGCFEGQCVTGPLPNGIACTVGVCREGACEGAAASEPASPEPAETKETVPVEEKETAELPGKQLVVSQALCGGLSCNDNNPCTIDLCKDNACAYAAAIDGTKCAEGASCQGGICLKVVGGQATPPPTQDLWSSPLVLVLVVIGAVILVLQIVSLLKK